MTELGGPSYEVYVRRETLDALVLERAQVLSRGLDALRKWLEASASERWLHHEAVVQWAGEQLRAAGVRVLSHQEPRLDTGGPVGDLLLAIFSWVAQQERARIAERVRAGLARARAQGVRLGGPRRVVDMAAVRERRARGESWRKIARALRIPTSTLRRCAKIPLGDLEDASRAPHREGVVL